MRTVRIGTRESLLAAAQAELLKHHIESRHPDITVTLVKIKTEGDRILDKRLDEIGGKGLFVKELDLALQQGRTDLSVHSLKDMPAEESEDYPILGYSRRETPQDALVLPEGCTQPDPEKPFGTSSPRRSIQLSALYPGCQVKSVRGNVITRLQKLDSGAYSALVLAAAGLKRLGLGHRISRLFSVAEMIPAAGQGILAVQGRKDFDKSLLDGFFDEDAGWQALAERSFVKSLGGGCSLPVAAYAEIDKDGLVLTGMVPACGEAGVQTVRLSGKKQEAQQIGERLAAECEASGWADFTAEM